MRKVDGLEDVIERSEAESIVRNFLVCKGCQENDTRARRSLVDFAEDFDAAHLRDKDVQKNDIDVWNPDDQVQRVFSRARSDDFVTAGGKEERKQFSRIVMIIDDQQFRFFTERKIELK